MYNKGTQLTGVLQGLPGLPYYFPTHIRSAVSHTPSREHISKEVVSGKKKKCILFLPAVSCLALPEQVSGSLPDSSLSRSAE